MSGPFAKIIANLVVMGAGVVSKAFMQAYQQAIVNAKSGKTVSQAAATAVRKKGMSKNEALDILNFTQKSVTNNVDALPSSKDLQDRYDKYFNANDPSKGGSFYLQSKIFRAKEALDAIAQEETKRGKDQEKAL